MKKGLLLLFTTLSLLSSVHTSFCGRNDKKRNRNYFAQCLAQGNWDAAQSQVGGMRGSGDPSVKSLGRYYQEILDALREASETPQRGQQATHGDQQEMIQALVDALENQTDQLEQERAQVAHVNQQLAQIQVRNRQLEQGASQQPTVDAQELVRLRQENDRLQQENRRLTAFEQLAQPELTRTADLRRRVQTLEPEIETLRQNSQREVEEARRQHDAQLEQVRQENAQLNRENQQLRTPLADSPTLAQLEELRQENERLDRENQQLRTQLEGFPTPAQLEELRQQVTDLTRQVEVARRLATQAVQERADLEEQNRRLEIQLRALQQNPEASSINVRPRTVYPGSRHAQAVPGTSSLRTPQADTTQSHAMVSATTHGQQKLAQLNDRIPRCPETQHLSTFIERIGPDNFATVIDTALDQLHTQQPQLMNQLQAVDQTYPVRYAINSILVSVQGILQGLQTCFEMDQQALPATIEQMCAERILQLSQAQKQQLLTMFQQDSAQYLALLQCATRAALTQNSHNPTRAITHETDERERNQSVLPIVLPEHVILLARNQAVLPSPARTQALVQQLVADASQHDQAALQTGEQAQAVALVGGMRQQLEAEHARAFNWARDLYLGPIFQLRLANFMQRVAPVATTAQSQTGHDAGMPEQMYVVDQFNRRLQQNRERTSHYQEILSAVRDLGHVSQDSTGRGALNVPLAARMMFPMNQRSTFAGTPFRPASRNVPTPSQPAAQPSFQRLLAGWRQRASAAAPNPAPAQTESTRPGFWSRLADAMNDPAHPCYWGNL